MNPILEALRKLFAGYPDTSPPPTGNYPASVNTNYKDTNQQDHINNIAGLNSSAFADSLRALTGNQQVKATDMPMGHVGRNYLNGFISMNSNPQTYQQVDTRNQTPASLNTPRSAMIHEFSHNIDTKRGPNPILDAFLNTATQHVVQRPSENSTWYPKEKASSPLLGGVYNIDPYYNDNTLGHPPRDQQHEAFAQSFVNAFQFLQDTAKDPKMDWQEYLGKLEGNTPGMGSMVMTMLDQPIYSKHPLRPLLRPQPEKKK